MVTTTEVLLYGGLGVGALFLLSNSNVLGGQNAGSTNVTQREIIQTETIENNVIRTMQLQQATPNQALSSQAQVAGEESNAEQKRGFFGNIIDSARSEPRVPTFFSRPSLPNVNPDRGERTTFREQLDTGNVLIDLPVTAVSIPLDVIDSASFAISQDIRNPEENRNEFQQRAFETLSMRGVAGEGTSIETPEDIPFRAHNRIIEVGRDFFQDFFSGIGEVFN